MSSDPPISLSSYANLPSRFVLSGKYKILSIIGTGGMSVVYKAKHLELDKDVAIKMLNRRLIIDENAIQRFHREIQTVSNLEHPNIVKVLAAGQFHFSQFLVMEYLDAQNLSDILQEKTRLSESAALKIFLQIVDALSYAHGQGVIHRDLKPSNVMIEAKSQRAKLVDFGIAKMLPQNQKQFATLTQTGDLFGSIHYMSPEQCNCEPLDARSDIYSMGCLMYECLTGQTPFAAESPPQLIAKHINSPVPPNKSLKTPLGKVVLRCLEKRPENRPQTAEQLKQWLQHPKEMPPLKQSRFTLRIAVLALVLASMAASLIAWRSLNNNAPSKATAHRDSVDGKLSNYTLKQRLESYRKNAEDYYRQHITALWIETEVERGGLLQTDLARDQQQEILEFLRDESRFKEWLARDPIWSEKNLRPLLAGDFLSLKLGDAERAFRWSSMGEAYAKKSADSQRYLTASVDSVQALQLWGGQLESHDQSLARQKYQQSIAKTDADLQEFPLAPADRMALLLELKARGYLDLIRTDKPTEVQDHLNSLIQTANLILGLNLEKSASEDSKSTMRTCQASARNLLAIAKEQLAKLPTPAK
jgi:serine/threonine protein kinase